MGQGVAALTDEVCHKSLGACIIEKRLVGRVNTAEHDTERSPRWNSFWGRVIILIVSIQIAVLLLLAVIAFLLLRQSRSIFESSGELSRRIIESAEENRKILNESIELHEKTNTLIERSNEVMEEFNSLMGVYNTIVSNQNDLLTVELRPQIDLELHIDREGLEQIIISNRGKPLLDFKSRGYAYVRLNVVEKEREELFSFAIPYYNYYSYPEYKSLLSGQVATIESRGFFGEQMTPEEIAQTFRDVLRDDDGFILVSAQLERYVSIEYTDSAQRGYAEMYFVDESKFYRIDPVETRRLTAAYIRFKRYEYSFLIDGTTAQKIKELWKDLLEEIAGRG